MKGCMKVILKVLLVVIACAPGVSAALSDVKLLAPLRAFIQADTLFDNTKEATAPFGAGGWVSSGGEETVGFGLPFSTGSSSYLLKSVTLMVSTLPMEAEFRGRLEVSLYAISEGKAIPDSDPLATSVLEDVSIPQREKYITVPVSFPLLESNKTYAIVMMAPNLYVSRIMGYQVPDVSPTPMKDISMGLPFYGSQKSGWMRLMNPYIWVQGWNIGSPETHRKAVYWSGGLGLGGLLGIILLFFGIRGIAKMSGRWV